VLVVCMPPANAGDVCTNEAAVDVISVLETGIQSVCLSALFFLFTRRSSPLTLVFLSVLGSLFFIALV